MTRRRFLGVAGAALGGAVGVDVAMRVLDAATRRDSGGLGSVGDIDHFVLLMQENRSFDHYFGSMSGVRGFEDVSTAFRQSGLAAGGRAREVLPFHLDTHARPDLDADVINDPAHSWVVQHESWNHGAMDDWLRAHAADDGAATPMLMGYYTRSDLPVHYALADAFTVCDHYFCSVLGPTSPNRLYWMTATIDPDGAAGGPVIGNINTDIRGELSWPTFPELLEEVGVSWKIYNAPYSYRSQLNGVVQHFKAYQPGTALFAKGMLPTYPHDFVKDVENGTLPHVSWLIPPMARSEHPAFPPAVGADEIIDVLSLLSSRPALWERTALIVSYDENGGLFDHVPPPTPPPRTPQEYAASGSGFEPIGLGFRVPCLVISPYSRGGVVSGDVYDHTSQLRLLGARFDLPVPNLSPWRAAVTNDMTSVFRRRRPGPPPSFPQVEAQATAAVSDDSSLITSGLWDKRPPFVLPPVRMPTQERWPIRPRLTG